MHLNGDIIEKACAAFLAVYDDPSAKPLDYGHEVSAALTAALHEMAMQASREAIAYRFRDYADGWIFTEDRRAAEVIRDTDGVRMEPVYSQAHVMALQDQVARLQRALAYWMPGISEEIEIETSGRAGDDACLLYGYMGELEESYWDAKAKKEAKHGE